MDDSVALAAAIRHARKARKLSITALAEQTGVSPRLIGELERGMRPNVSLATTLRVLAVLDLRITVQPATSVAQRRERAAQRRATWQGQLGTVSGQKEPQPPSTSKGRLGAVAAASRVAVGLRRAATRAR